jgi:hypothetical protein
MMKWIGAAYDKLALFTVLFILLVSVVLLGVFVEQEKKELAAARWNRSDVPPRNSKPGDVTLLHEAIDSVVAPFQMAYGPAPMMVPELRVACVACGRPIPYAADKCPFANCGVDQEREKGLDEWQGWNKLYKLSPAADDPEQDTDNDQYADREEFQYKTHPRDVSSHPPPVIKLKWTRTAQLTLPFTFQSVQHPAQGQEIFVLKNKKINRDYYVKIGEKVEGYEVIGYEPRTTNVTLSSRMIIPEDVSILKIRKGDKVIVLTRGQTASQGEWVAELYFAIDKSKPQVKVDDVISLQNNPYQIVDIRKDGVVVSDNLTGEKFSLEKYYPD